MINKILIVGQGSIGIRHLSIIKELMPECDVRTFSKHIQSSNTKVKNFKNLKDALSFNPDAAVIANPSSKHISVAKPLLMKGVHLLIETNFFRFCKGNGSS